MTKQPDLFSPISGAAEVVDRTVLAPKAERPKAPDWWLLIAQQRGVPEGWRWVSLEVLDTKVPRAQAHNLITGAVYSTLLKSGPRKGEPNFKKPDPGTERRLVISFAELDAFCAQWERETGTCSKCIGSGEELARYSSVDGSTYRTCSRCRGTGKVVPSHG